MARMCPADAKPGFFLSLHGCLAGRPMYQLFIVSQRRLQRCEQLQGVWLKVVNHGDWCLCWVRPPNYIPFHDWRLGQQAVIMCTAIAPL
eukprot:1161813-Pelagomonas_calceolata.AAC.14